MNPFKKGDIVQVVTLDDLPEVQSYNSAEADNLELKKDYEVDCVNRDFIGLRGADYLHHYSRFEKSKTFNLSLTENLSQQGEQC